MKKFLLSLGVVVTFAIYSFYQKSNLSQISTPIPPDNPNPTPPLSTPSQSPTSAVNNIITYQPTSTPIPLSPAQTPTTTGTYKDGQYTGSVADAFYVNVQVKATIQNGKISSVDFLQYPNDRERSLAISSQAIPMLQQEAISAQSANVDIVSGATDTSHAFIESLNSALIKAR
jgi:uncharacterized protein with FMN-binding domain